MLKKFDLKKVMKNKKSESEISAKTAKANEEKGKFRVFANCYNGGRVCECLKKSGGNFRDFSCSRGEMEFSCNGLSRNQIVEIFRKCGGENIEIISENNKKKIFQRLPFLAGVAVFCIILFFSSLVVLKVEVEGEDEVVKTHLQNETAEIFPIFSLKTQERMQSLENLLENCEDVAFYNIENYQNKIVVNFLKSQKGIVIEGEKSMLAPADGVIVSISTLSGRAVVEVGDSVSKGDVLIVAESGGENPIEVEKAVGSCEILASKSETFTFPQIAEEKAYTGETETACYFSFGKKEVGKKKSSFQNFETQAKKVFFILPNVSFIRETRIEYKTATVAFTEEELKEKGIAVFKSRFLKNFAYTIDNVSASSEISGEICKVTVNCEYLFEINQN